MKPSLFLIFFILCNYIFAQSPVFKHYTIDNGLPSNEVYRVIQDSKGYMWFATNYGVSCFDGYQFRNFDSQDGLPDNTIIDIYEDTQKRIWFVSLSGLFSYHQNGVITPYINNQKITTYFKQISRIVSNSFYVDSIDNLHFCVYAKGLYVCQPNGTIYKQFKNNPDFPLTTVFVNKKKQIFQDFNNTEQSLEQAINHTKNKKNLYYISIDKAMCIKNQYKDVQFLSIVADIDTSIFVFPFKLNINAGMYTNIINKNSELICGRSTSFYIVKNKQIKFINIGQRIQYLTNDKELNVWCGTNNGAYFYKGGDVSRKQDAILLSGQSISAILEDREKGIWFTTTNSGVFYLPSYKFRTYTIADGLPAMNISDICEGKDNTVYACSDTCNYLFEINSNVTLHKLPIKEFAPRCLKFDRILNKLFIGSINCIYFLDNDKITVLKDNVFWKSKILGFISSEVVLGKNGSVNIASNKGLIRIENNKMKCYSPGNDTWRIHSIENIVDNSFWIGRSDGLWKFSDSTFSYFGNQNELLSKRITCLKNYDNSRLCIGTKGYGIVIYSKKNTLQILEKNGLCSNFITTLFIDNNTIWAGSNNGLDKIEIESFQPLKYNITHFSKSNGLASNEINKVLVSKDRVYVATSSGLTIFDCKLMRKSRITPPIYITSLKILGRDTSFHEKLNLSYNENIISIDYIGLCYKQNGKTQYKYRLKGLSEKWQNTLNTKVQYPYLPAGEYAFEVFAFNEDGISSTRPACVYFIIHPPFWKTWWFIVLLVLATAGSFWLIFYLRIKELKTKQKLKEDLNNYMQQALTKQMNPHFIFNSLNSIHNFILENDKNSSSIYLSKFAKLMRMSLEFSQQQKIALEDEVSMLSLYLELESLRFKSRFQYSITVSDDIDTKFIELPALLIQPYIENSIWHGIMHKENGNGMINLNFSLSKEMLLCEIIDNGVGREKAMEIKSQKNVKHKSYGTSITEKRLNLINSLYGTEVGVTYEDLRDELDCATGTKVTIKISIG